MSLTTYWIAWVTVPALFYAVLIWRLAVLRRRRDSLASYTAFREGN